MIDITQLRRMAPNGDARVHVAIVQAAEAGLLARHELDSELRLAHWLGQAAQESMGFSRLEESGSYSASRLRAVFPRYFTPAQARAYARKPKAILSRAYAGRLGNGPESSGDGWQFRGRGIIQLTGRANYRRYAEITSLPLEDDPKLAGEPEIAVRLAAAYWQQAGLSAWADRDDVLAVSRGINLGNPHARAWPNGMNDRKIWLKRAKQALAMPVPDPLADGMLAIGDKGDAVAELQRALKGAGYPVGDADGVFGEMTRDAVIIAQERLGLDDAELGAWDPADNDKLAQPEAVRVPEPRREAREQDLRERGDKTIGLLDWFRRAITFLGFGGVVGGQAAATAPGLFEAFKTAWAPLATAADWIAKNPWALWGIAALVAYAAVRQVARRYVEGYRAGRNMGDGT